MLPQVATPTHVRPFTRLGDDVKQQPGNISRTDSYPTGVCGCVCVCVKGIDGSIYNWWPANVLLCADLAFSLSRQHVPVPALICLFNPICSGTGLPVRLCLVRFRVQSTNAASRRPPAPQSDCILLHFTPVEPHWLELHSRLISSQDPLEAACKWKSSEALPHEPLTRISPTIQIRGSGLLTIIKTDALTASVKALEALIVPPSVCSNENKEERQTVTLRPDGLPLWGKISKRQHRRINKHIRQHWGDPRCGKSAEQSGNPAEKCLAAACFSWQEALRQKSNSSRLDFYLRAICRVKYRAVDKENEAGEKKF